MKIAIDISSAAGDAQTRYGYLASKPWLAVFITCICVASIIGIGYIQLELSIDDPRAWTFAEHPKLVVANLSLVACLLFVIPIIMGRVGASLAVVSVVISLIAVVNGYTLMLHGSPLCYSELRNVGTAVSVLGNYSLAPTPVIWQIIVLGALCLGVSLLAWFVERKAGFSRPTIVRVAGTVLLTLSIGSAWLLTLSPHAAFSVKYAINWSRVEAACNYGYPCFLLADAVSTTNPATKPEPYDLGIVDDSLASRNGSPGQSAKQSASKPDIIIVLNETFFDLGAYADIETDHPYLDDFYGIPGATFGTVIAPGKGGGTNDAEFELLTSHDLALFRVNSLFNFIDFGKSHDNNVSYLQSLGYHTMAFHVADPHNYNRQSAYPAMGFDDVFLGREYFPDCVNYGNRPWNDAGSYARVLDELNACGDEPQFSFLLTYQNHGGWDQNDASLDIVHVSGDYGYPNDEINEYLTSLSQSANAFADFIDALRHRNRDTIVFMMGDHAPSFIGSLQAKEGLPYDSETMCRRVPCLVWSNFDMDTSAFDGTMISTIDAIPLLLDAALIPQSPYQQTIVDIANQYPVRMKDGSFIDAEGKYGPPADNSAVQCETEPYFIMEYNAISHGDDYREEWFRPAQ